MFAPRKTIYPIYNPYDEQLGMDWLSMLGRMREAETGKGQVNTPIFVPTEQLQPNMPNAYGIGPDSVENMMQKKTLMGGMFGRGL